MMATIFDFREQVRADDRGFARGHWFMAKDQVDLPVKRGEGQSLHVTVGLSLQNRHHNAKSARMIE